GGDAVVSWQSIGGADPLHPPSVPEPIPDYRAAETASVRGLVIGKPKEDFPPDLDARIRDHCDAALERLVPLGAEVRDVSLPHSRLAIAVDYIIASAEASSNLARVAGFPY